MKDTTELIDLVEGREPEGDGGQKLWSLEPEPSALRELREKVEAAFAFWPGLSEETRARLAEWIETAAKEAGV